MAMGTITFAPQIAPDYYRELKIHFNAFAKGLTILHGLVEKVTLATYIRYLIASLQTVFGLMMMENGYFGKKFHLIGNIGLGFLNMLVFGLQIYSGFTIEKVGPTLIFLILLVGRFVLVEQSTKKPKVGMKTRNEGKPKTSTPKKNKHD